MYVPKCFQTNITKEKLIKKMKNQETLEEAAEKYNSQFIGQNEFAIEDFKNGAKWQAERMYSEEDMKSFGDWCRNALLNTEYSFEKLDEHLKTWEQIRNK